MYLGNFSPGQKAKLWEVGLEGLVAAGIIVTSSAFLLGADDAGDVATVLIGLPATYWIIHFVFNIVRMNVSKKYTGETLAYELTFIITGLAGVSVGGAIGTGIANLLF